MNPYSVLELPMTATREEIRAAYIKMARRWHPDRYLEGQERKIANDKMADINAAYRALTRGFKLGAQPVKNESEGNAFRLIEQMIDVGQYAHARKMLMDFTTRSAEWNYLFGAILMKTSDINKAQIYLSIAAHQQPDNEKYARALRQAQTCDTPHDVFSAIKRRIFR